MNIWCIGILQEMNAYTPALVTAGKISPVKLVTMSVHLYVRPQFFLHNFTQFFSDLNLIYTSPFQNVLSFSLPVFYIFCLHFISDEFRNQDVKILK